MDLRLRGIEDVNVKKSQQSFLRLPQLTVGRPLGIVRPAHQRHVFHVGGFQYVFNHADRRLGLFGGRKGTGLSQSGRQPLRLGQFALGVHADHAVERTFGLGDFSPRQKGPARRHPRAHLVVGPRGVFQPTIVFGRLIVLLNSHQQVSDDFRRLKIMVTFSVVIDESLHQPSGVDDLSLARKRQFRRAKGLVKLDLLPILRSSGLFFLDPFQGRQAIGITPAQHVGLRGLQVRGIRLEKDGLDLVDGNLLRDPADAFKLDRQRTHAHDAPHQGLFMGFDQIERLARAADQKPQHGRHNSRADSHEFISLNLKPCRL